MNKAVSINQRNKQTKKANCQKGQDIETDLKTNQKFLNRTRIIKILNQGRLGSQLSQLNF